MHDPCDNCNKPCCYGCIYADCEPAEEQVINNKINYDKAIAEIQRHKRYNELESIQEEKNDLLSLIQNSTTLNKYWKDLFFRVLELQKQELQFKI